MKRALYLLSMIVMCLILLASCNSSTSVNSSLPNTQKDAANRALDDIKNVNITDLEVFDSTYSTRKTASGCIILLYSTIGLFNGVR